MAFTLLALQGFGGVLAVVQREIVEKRQWLTNEEFVEDWAVAQIMPGPNVVNLSLMLGARYFGFSGAMCALAGMLTCPLVIVLLMATLYAQVGHLPQVQGALRGMGAVAAGLIAATGLKLLPALRSNPMGRAACALIGVAAFAAIAAFKLPLGQAMLLVGVPACVWAYVALGRGSDRP